MHEAKNQKLLNRVLLA